MNARYAAVVVAIVASLTTEVLAVPDVPDWIIFPGKRVGKIDARSSEADLKRIFGDDSVIHDADVGGNLLIPHNDPGSSLHIVWRNPKTRVGVKQVTAKLGRFQWKTHHGIQHDMRAYPKSRRSTGSRL